MNFNKWETRFKYIGNDILCNCFDNYWVVTDFVKNFNNKNIQFVIQPLVEDRYIGDGVTGLHAYVITEEELKKYFEMIDPPNDNNRSIKIISKYIEDFKNMTDEEFENEMRKIGLIE